MEKKTVTCIICPRGCSVTVDGDVVSGNSCVRGRDYAIAEITNPVRTVTSSVRVANREHTMLSVKTAAPVPKAQMFALMDTIRKTTVLAPVKIGDKVIENILGTDLVATSNVD